MVGFSNDALVMISVECCDKDRLKVSQTGEFLIRIPKPLNFLLWIPGSVRNSPKALTASAINVASALRV